MLMRIFVYIAVLGFAASSAMAQERAAGSALDVQMTWSTLKSLVDDANATSKAVDTRLTAVDGRLVKVKGRVDSIETCNLKGMIYAPGKGGDKDDCIVPKATVETEYVRRVTYVEDSVTCIQKGGTFSSAGAPPAGGWKPGDKTGTCVMNAADDKGLTYYSPANRGTLQNTGFAVKKGRTLSFSVRGKATMSVSTASGYGYLTADQDYPGPRGGCMLRGVVSSAPIFKDTYSHVNGGGTSFCIRSNTKVKAAASGDLYVGVPDGGSEKGDNYGGYTITVTQE